MQIWNFYKNLLANTLLISPAIPPTNQDGNRRNVDVKVSETNGWCHGS